MFGDPRERPDTDITGTPLICRTLDTARSVRREVRGEAMAPLELSAHMTGRPRCLEGFKKQAGELIRITQEKVAVIPICNQFRVE